VNGPSALFSLEEEIEEISHTPITMAGLSTLLATTVALISASLTSGFVAPSGFVVQ